MLIKKINEKDKEIEAMRKVLDGYSYKTVHIQEWEETREVKKERASILRSMVDYIKEHPYLITTAVTAGIICGFLSFYGIPYVHVWGTITRTAAVAHGCVVGGSTLLIGDLIVSEQKKQE